MDVDHVLPHNIILNAHVDRMLGKYYPYAKLKLTEDEVTPADLMKWSEDFLDWELTPMPVSTRYSDTSIFGSEMANGRNRMWHDLVHLELELGFTYEEEIRVAAYQLDQLGGVKTRTYRAFEADTLGMTLYHAIAEEFPKDQSVFAMYYMAEGIRPFAKGLRV